jgi:RHS repeat-associated protein
MQLTEFSSSRTQWHKHNKFPAPTGTRFHRINQPETCHTRYNTGTVADHIVYDSFGNITSQSDSGNAMLMGFDGYQYDSETGLYYANARYYSPSLGRFISQDPTGFAAGDSNLYRFVGNHPTYSTDPTGLFEGGSAFTQGTGSYGLGGNSMGSAPVSLTGGTQAAWMNSPYSSPTASISPFGGAGPITAPTSTGGYGAGSGGGNSGSNTISFSLGNGLSPSGGYLGNSAVYAPMGGGGLGIGSLSSAQISANLPTAASSAAYMQGLMSAYPAVVHTGVVQDVNSIIQESNMAAGEVFPVVGALQSAGTALSSWGQSEAALGNAGWGAMGMFLGGVANAAAAVGNPVGSLLGLSEQSYNVAYRDGAGAGIAYGVGSVIGATQLTQAVIGQNFATGQALSGLDRWGMAAQGVSAASGTAALSLGVSGYNPAVFGGTAGTASIMSAPITGSPVTWVEETTGMSSAAEDYGAGATGARSNLISGYRQLPQLGYMRADGSLQMVRFDGYENNVLIDRKLGVVDSPRGYEEAIRQSTALLEHGLTGRWEVPNAREAATAVKMFNNVGITNISVRIVPP